MEQQYTYAADISWSDGKTGSAVADGLPDVVVSTPPEFGGPSGKWSPEHLLVASLGSCIMTTFLAIAEASKFAFSHYRSHVEGTIERLDSGYEFTRITVSVDLGVADERAATRGERLLHKAEQNCFISNSLKASVELVPQVQVVS